MYQGTQGQNGDFTSLAIQKQFRSDNSTTRSGQRQNMQQQITVIEASPKKLRQQTVHYQPLQSHFTSLNNLKDKKLDTLFPLLDSATGTQTRASMRGQRPLGHRPSFLTHTETTINDNQRSKTNLI